MEPTTEQFDVVIVGAGIAGISAASELRRSRPDCSFVVLDALEGIGGTWWTHRFPGVRSDTEVFTLGFEAKPWLGAPYASGEAIRTYLEEAVEESGITDAIRTGHRVRRASWSSTDQRWTLTVDRTTDGGVDTITVITSFLWMCHGYYRHDAPHRPDWPGMEEFAGTWIHPQHWPEDTDLAGKEVVVIGSGATAATLVPAIAETCGHVTLLQRSPTYFFQSPNADALADQLRSLDTPPAWTHAIVRRKATEEMRGITETATTFPDAMAAGLIGLVAAALPEGYDVATHFTPRHAPADQRIARLLDGDLLAAVAAGTVTMVTDEIATFTPTGLTTVGGTDIAADVVITATGFDLSIFGEVAFTVDDRPVDFADSVTYRGILFTGVPNMAWTFGALRMSWTMRVELVSRYVCRLLDHLEAEGATSVVPVLRDEDAGMALTPFVDPAHFSPGYLVRAADAVPRSGSVAEWRYDIDFWAERPVLEALGFDDGCLTFTRPPA